MNIFLVGVGCVGKSAIGNELAKILNYQFIDLDREIENYHNLSIERIQKHMSISVYRKAGAKVLQYIISQKQDRSNVIVLPSSGMTAPYRKVIHKDRFLVIALEDTPNNILKRIVFYDVNSMPISYKLTPKRKIHYLHSIKEDQKYFGKFYKKADLKINIAGLSIFQCVQKLTSEINNFILSHSPTFDKPQSIQRREFEDLLLNPEYQPKI